MTITARDFITHVARRAGEMLMGFFRQDPALPGMRSTAKEAATKYDKMVDQVIIEDIQNEYPDHSILTEESGYSEKSPDWLWIIDSLDGTGNFANQNPFFTVCIALLYKGEPISGAINAPALGEFFVAEKGGGAWLNDKRIEVSRIADLKKSYVLYCEGSDRDRARTGGLLNAVYVHVTDIRKLGSAGLEAAWVAAGRSEAYFTTQIEPWDVAAAVVLVSEAGGRTTDCHGNLWKPEKSDLVFSNGLVHDQILTLLNEKERIG